MQEFSEDVRRDLKQAFRIIYRSGFSLSKAIEEMELQLDSSVEIENLLRFLRNADRGIMRTRRELIMRTSYKCTRSFCVHYY